MAGAARSRYVYDSVAGPQSVIQTADKQKSPASTRFGLHLVQTLYAQNVAIEAALPS